jgi:CRP-like cAMP-binding protein
MILDAPTATRRRGSAAMPVTTTDNLLLARLDPADREAMDPYLRPTALTQGRVLFEPGEEITHLHFPRSGAVSLVLVMGDGSWSRRSWSAVKA